MHYSQLILNDIFFSPLIYHVAALLISTLKSLGVKLFSSYANESAGWDSAIMLMLFFNPFLAFLANSFWTVWLQTLVLSLPLYFLGFYYRQYLLRINQYADASAAIMIAAAMYFLGHLISGIAFVVSYLWQSF